ncbi:MAG: hypothetical protein KDD61_04705 [Bdellovibrionales bacterium]|nr:hypothetical protein [Bdellovibrionales bacterium]
MTDAVTHSEKGMAMMEALLAMIVLLSLFSIAATIFYVSYSKLVLDHLTYQTTLCLAKHTSPRTCRKQALSQGKDWLPIGKLRVRHLNKKASIKCQLRKRHCFDFFTSLEWSITSAAKTSIFLKFPKLSSSYLLSEEAYNL